MFRYLRVNVLAINLHDLPEKITIDKSGANTAAIESIKADACVDILMRQNKYLNNIVEQDHRAVKRITGPMLGFKSFWSARIIIAGIETMHMIKKGQMNCPEGSTLSEHSSSTASLFDHQVSDATPFGQSPLLRQNRQSRCHHAGRRSRRR